MQTAFKLRVAEVSELSVAIGVGGGWRYSISFNARVDVDAMRGSHLICRP